MALTGSTNAEKIWNFLIAKGCTPYGVAAAMGNLFAESGLLPNNLQNSYNSELGYTDDGYANAVDSGKYTAFSTDEAGWGLCQWTYPTRKAALLKYAKTKGVSIADLEMQLEYLWIELSQSYTTVLRALKTATSVKEASDIFMVRFEAPADQSADAKNDRAEIGLGYYNTFAKKTVTEKKEVVNMSVADKVLQQLANLAGEKENTANVTTVTKYYGAQSAPYCGYSLKYAFDKAGYSSIIKGCSNIAYVPTVREWMDAQGWRVSNSSAKAGDIFVYGSDDHVGFVYQPYSGTTVITLEGNSKVYATLAQAKSSTTGTGAFEGIGFKKRNLNSKFKVYRPAYDGATKSTFGTGSTASTATNTYVSSPMIMEFQKWLKSNYTPSLAADGEYGPKTKEAAVTAFQMYMKKNYVPTLDVDGDFGSESKASLTGRALKVGSQGDLVRILQGVLYGLGYNPNGFDGVYGSGTRAAVIKFQNERKLGVDGSAGKDTFYAMLA